MRSTRDVMVLCSTMTGSNNQDLFILLLLYSKGEGDSEVINIEVVTSTDGKTWSKP